MKTRRREDVKTQRLPEPLLQPVLCDAMPEGYVVVPCAIRELFLHCLVDFRWRRVALKRLEVRLELPGEGLGEGGVGLLHLVFILRLVLRPQLREVVVFVGLLRVALHRSRLQTEERLRNCMGGRR